MRVQSGQWRFILILLFIGLVIFAIVRAPKFLNAQTIFSDDFDSYTVDDLVGQGNWQQGSGNSKGYQVDDTFQFSSPNSAKIFNVDSTNTSRIYNLLTASTTNNYWISGRFLANQDSCTQENTPRVALGVSFSLTPTAPRRAIGFSCNETDSNQIWVGMDFNTGNDSGTTTVLANTWNFFSNNFDQVNGIRTLYVNNIFVGTSTLATSDFADRMWINRSSNNTGDLNVYFDDVRLTLQDPQSSFTQIVTLIEHHQTLATSTAIVEAIYDLTEADEPRYSNIFYDFLNLDTNEQWTTMDPSFPSSGISPGLNQNSFGGAIPPLTFFPPGMYLLIVGFVADPAYWGFSPFEDPDCYWDPFSPDHDCVLASPVVHFSKTFQFVVGTSIYGEYEDGTLVQPPTPEFEIDCSGETGLDFVVCKVGELLSDLFSWIMDQIKAFFGISGVVLQNAFNLLKEHFFSRAPWGYGLRIYEIICGQFSISTLTCSGPATSTLPTLIVTAPAWVEEHTGANFGAGIDWAPWGENRFQFIQDSIEEQEVENIATTTDAWQSFLAKWRMTWNLLFALFLLYIVFGIQWTLESGREIDQKYGGL